MRPSIAAALRNRIAGIGIALTTAAGLLFVVLVGLELFGFLASPYAGIVVYVMVPAIFILGLLVIPLGLAIERRQARRGLAASPWPRIDFNDPGVRRMFLFVGAATLVNIGIVSMASFGAVKYTESQQFCGQVCHAVMEPEFVAHQAGSHGRIHCVQCHVGPGAQGFVSAKLAGTRQLALVLTGNYHRPIPTPIAGLPGVQNSCESCHRPDRFVGDLIKVIYEHADDEANTETKTTLRMHVGGPISGTNTGIGIHWHMNRRNQVEYIALDEKREQIPYVRVTTPNGNMREYFAEGLKPADLEGKPRRRMDCLDCHSRPAHRFAASPEREVDAAIGASEINSKIPFIRREAVRAVRAEYPSQEIAIRQIDRTIRDVMNARQPPAFDEADLRQAIGVTQAIYRANVFPSMKVSWGTYPNQLGHITSNGCFRCHDESHKTTAGMAIGQDCETCHAIE
jgi:hypothetical protein